MSGTELENVLAHQLSVVLVGGEHIGFDAGNARFHRKSADDVIGLKAIDLQTGDVPRLEQLLDDGHRAFDVLGCLLALRLILRESFVAERLPVVESHADVSGVLLVDDFLERVHKPHHGRCVQAFRVDAWVLDECVVGAIDERIGIEEK